MSRLDVVLALLVLVCALAVIQAQHRSRTYFVELERLKKEAHGLDEQWGQLKLEQGTWANPARVDLLARTRLGLTAPPPDHVRIEALPDAP